MTQLSPTPQDREKADQIARDHGFTDYHNIKRAIASALAAERERYETEIKRLREVLVPLLNDAGRRAAVLRHQANNSTSGLARALLEDAKRIEAMCIAATDALRGQPAPAESEG